MRTGSRASANTADAVIASARGGEPDRYLAALLGPASAREDLVALAAFSAELRRALQVARREPLMGQVRLQWWRDALAQPEGERTGHPVADAVRAAVARHRLPLALLEGVIDARSADLADEPIADEAALRARLAASEGALFALAASVLSLAEDTAAACAASGQAYGLARLMLDLPQTLSQGRVPLPSALIEAAGLSRQELLSGRADKAAPLLAHVCDDARAHLELAHAQLDRLSRSARIAFLPLALVGPYLQALARPGRDPLRQEAGIAPLTRVWRLAAAHWFGRI